MIFLLTILFSVLCIKVMCLATKLWLKTAVFFVQVLAVLLLLALIF